MRKNKHIGYGRNIDPVLKAKHYTFLRLRFNAIYQICQKTEEEWEEVC